MPNLRNVVNTLKLINEIRLTGGVSYNINTGDLNPPYGYMVSQKGHEEIVKIIDEETVKSYITRHSAVLAKENAYFGCWFDGTNYVFDVSEHHERKRDAVFYAIVNKQRAIWDCAAFDEIAVNPRGSLVKQYINA